MALIYRLYGEKDYSRFSEAWMLLAHTVTTYGRNFNWGDIISKQLSTRIEEVQNQKPGETPSFYMASYLLDAICTRNVFPSLSLR